MQSNEARVIEALFHILDKEGHQVPFRLNESQLAYDRVKTTRDLIPKARQKGFSSLGVAYQVVKCLGVPGTRAVLISHEAGATQRLLDRAQFYLKHINGPKPVLGRNSRNELYFPKTESTYYIGTAGARAFGRGDTITDLHISEYAWWENTGLRHVAGLMQAVPQSGCVRFESTGNGMSNDFYYMVSNAEKLGYSTFFRSWHDDNEYQREPKHGWVPEGFETYFQDMKLRYNLSEPQLYWYWLKLLEFRLDLKMMQQEYPSCLEECFQATGGAIFHDLHLEQSNSWDWSIYEGHRIESLSTHPKPRYTYVIGADPSGGTGNDEAGVQIICLDTLEQVLEMGDKNIDPVDLGYYLILLGKKYNESYIVCEANNHGIATHSILKKLYPRQKLYKELLPKRDGKIRYGIITTENSKHALVGRIKEALALGLTIYGHGTMKEMLAFHEDPETGKMGAPQDNRVIALGMACQGVFKYLHMKRDLIPKAPPPQYVPGSGMSTTFEQIFANLDKRRNEGRGIFPNMLN